MVRLNINFKYDFLINIFYSINLATFKNIMNHAMNTCVFIKNAHVMPSLMWRVIFTVNPDVRFPTTTIYSFFSAALTTELDVHSLPSWKITLLHIVLYAKVIMLNVLKSIKTTTFRRKHNAILK